MARIGVASMAHGGCFHGFPSAARAEGLEWVWNQGWLLMGLFKGWHRMQHTGTRAHVLITAWFLAVGVGVGVAVTTATSAVAAAASVSITAYPATAGTQSTLTYRATSTGSGTVRSATLQLPAGSTGRLTTVNGSLRTVSPGVIQWVPSAVITVGVGARFSIPVYGVGLPSSPGTHTLAFSSISTAGRSIFSGTGQLVLAKSVAAAATVEASVPIPGAVTTLTYTSKMSLSGTLFRLHLTLPAGAGGRLTSSTGVLRTVSPGVISWTPPAPMAVSGGRVVTAALGNVSLSVFGGPFSLPVTALSTSGLILSKASAPISLIAPPAQMAPPPVRALERPLAACPAAWRGVVEENALPGTDSWTIAADATGDALSAYLTDTSVRCGEQVTLTVDSGLPVSVTAYRMGYYAGKGGREIWSAQDVPTVDQPAAVLDDLKGVTAAAWSPTLAIPVTDAWTPGTYLIKVSDGELSTYAPLTVRDDTGTKHAFLLQQATATWQAYNTWGGYSFYRPRAEGSGRLHYDRPYAEGQGSGQFLSLERGLVFWMEAAGYDVTYWTNEDLDLYGSQLPLRASTLILPAHDEYFSTNMRAAVQHGIAGGVNTVNFGANAAYRKIAYSPDQRFWEIDRSSWDLSTRWWGLGDAYSSQALLGAEYVCPVSVGNLTTTSGWIFDGIAAGTSMPGFLAGEIDRVDPRFYRHPGLEVAYEGTATCRSGTATPLVHVTTFTAAKGAHVFNGSTFAYGCFVGGVCPSSWQVSAVPDASRQAAGTVVANVLEWASGATAPSGTARTGILPKVAHARTAVPLAVE